MLLGGGGLATGLFVEPGPGVVLPGGQGFATVAEVPGVDEVAGVVEVDPTPLLVVALPVPVVDELVLVDGVVPVPVVLAVLPGVDVELVELPILPLLEGVQGAVVVVVPDWPVVVP